MKSGILLLIAGIIVLFFGVCITPVLATLMIIRDIGTSAPTSAASSFSGIWETVGTALAVSLPLGGILVYIGRCLIKRNNLTH